MAHWLDELARNLHTAYNDLRLIGYSDREALDTILLATMEET